MLFIKQNIQIEDVNTINNFLDEFENIDNSSSIEEKSDSSVSLYITSLVSNKYAKSINDIENTKVGNKLKRKRSLQQVMQESFFYGANRFGNNFIA